MSENTQEIGPVRDQEGLTVTSGNTLTERGNELRMEDADELERLEADRQAHSDQEERVAAAYEAHIKPLFNSPGRVEVDTLVDKLKEIGEGLPFADRLNLVRAAYFQLSTERFSPAEYSFFKKRCAKELLDISKADLEQSINAQGDFAMRRLRDQLFPKGKFPDEKEPEEVEVAVDDWRSGLQYEKTNEGLRVVRNTPNAVRALQLCPDTVGLFRLNLLSGKTEIHGIAPWWPESQEVKEYRELSDLDCRQAQVYFNEMWQLPAEYGGIRINFSAEALDAAMRVEGARCQYDPVVDYLNGLQWDGSQRMETALNRVFGCEDTLYGRLVSRVLLTSLVARQLKPGCKSDIAVILEGDEAPQKVNPTVPRGLEAQRAGGGGLHRTRRNMTPMHAFKLKVA